MLKRVVLFVLTNILIVVVIGVIVSITGVNRFMHRQGLDIANLLIYSLVVGFSGALISLAISKIMAKWIMHVKVIDPRKPVNEAEQWLLQTTYNSCKNAGIQVMPEVGFYESEEVNAFATGPSKNRALVAVSTGLYNTMDKTAIEGVIAHEVTHIANGDMITMTLLQGVINTFVVFLSRIAAWIVSSFLGRNKDSGHFVYWILSFVFQIVFGILGSLVVFAFSRHREFRADYGAAQLAGKSSMLAALEELKLLQDQKISNQPAINTFKIAGQKSWMTLFSTHPNIEDRINKLKQAS